MGYGITPVAVVLSRVEQSFDASRGCVRGSSNLRSQPVSSSQVTNSLRRVECPATGGDHFKRTLATPGKEPVPCWTTDPLKLPIPPARRASWRSLLEHSSPWLSAPSTRRSFRSHRTSARSMPCLRLRSDGMIRRGIRMLRPRRGIRASTPRRSTSVAGTTRWPGC